MITALILGVSFFLGIKYFNTIDSWMNKIFK